MSNFIDDDNQNSQNIIIMNVHQKKKLLNLHLISDFYTRIFSMVFFPLKEIHVLIFRFINIYANKRFTLNAPSST